MIVEYENKPTLAHALDPRSKFAWLAAVVVISVLWTAPVYLAFLAFSVVVFGLAARFPWSKLKGLFLFLLVLTLFITVAQGITYKPQVAHLENPERVLFHLVPAVIPGLRPIGGIHLGGFLYGIAMMFKVFVVLLAVAIFGYVTSPSEVVQLIARIPHMPYQVGFIVSTAWKFIPVMQMQITSLMDAHRSKGVEFDKGSLAGKIRKTSRVISPLFANALSQADTLAQAMESRAFGSSRRFTFLRPYRFKFGDYVAIVLSLGAMAASIVGVIIFKVGLL